MLYDLRKSSDLATAQKVVGSPWNPEYFATGQNHTTACINLTTGFGLEPPELVPDEGHTRTAIPFSTHPSKLVSDKGNVKPQHLTMFRQKLVTLKAEEIKAKLTRDNSIPKRDK